jgi:hypothetical protein
MRISSIADTAARDLGKALVEGDFLRARPSPSTRMSSARK